MRPERPGGPAAGESEPAASRFLFVVGRYRGEEPAISCDGLVEGASLDLTHWEGNATPPELRADTSTEIALNFVESPAADAWRGAVAVNNHFDTDGLLAVWTLLAPAPARSRRDLIVAAAEVGDFEEWPSDPRAIRIDAALRTMGEESCDDGSAYERALAALPDLIDRIDERRDLWGSEWERLEAAERDLASGRVRVAMSGPIGIAVHAPGVPEAPGPLLWRGLPGARRLLLAFDAGGGRYHYRYERPRYAWAVTVRRPALPPPDGERIARSLGEPWSRAGAIGMTAILATDEPVARDPESAAAALARADTEL